MAVERGSPSTPTREETIKRRPYERSGVSEFLLLSPSFDGVVDESQ
jgi:hypothetical protein